MLNMNLEERIKLLKSELDVLNKEIEKSRSSYETSQKFLSLMGTPKLNQPEEFERWKKMVKEYIANELEFLRVQVETIRKISPSTANYISNDIKRYEESSRKLIEYAPKIQQMNLVDVEGSQFVLTFVELLTSYTKLHDMIKICRDCIRDTIERLSKQ